MHQFQAFHAGVETAPAQRPRQMATAVARRRRLAIVLPSPAMLGSLGYHVLAEARRRGHDVYCFAPEWDERNYRLVSGYGADPRNVRISMKSLSPLADERSVRHLASAFRTLEPHAVLSMSIKASALCAAAAKRAGVPHMVPMLMDFADAFEPGANCPSWLWRQFLKPYCRAALKSSHGVIVPNSGDEQMLNAMGLVPPNLKVTCVGAPGVDVRQIPHLDLPPLDRGIMFLMAADLERSEGVLEYCEAAEMLRSRARNARCLLAGRPGEGAGAFSLDELKRYRSAVQYLGPRDDVVQLIARSHVLVVPSHGLGRPGALSAALALGRPIIATNTRGLTEAVQHGVNGYLTSPKDATQLARAMALILQRPDSIAHMADASRAIAERRFDVREITYSVLSALKM